VLLAFLAACALMLACRAASAADPAPGTAILEQLKAYDELGSVLHVAAHPDDENTQLITYLALGRRYRTAYMSLTRGDGGQNLLGPEFGEQLGVIRTQELLAARRLDGGQQFFSRAIDFGFSKDVNQTLKIWDRQQVVGDIVRIIRKFRPDVIVTRFSTVPGTTHGHHTASAVLALEAYNLSGDPKAYPEQLDTLKPWKPKRIFMNSGGFGPGPAAGGAGVIRIDIGGNDPTSGEPFGVIAGRSRAMHKTQGFGNFGGFANRGPRTEAFQLMAGEPATKDILDGVDTTWNRIAGGSEIGTLTEKAITDFNPQDPSASVPALLAIRAKVAALAHDPLLLEKSRQVDKILQACLGLSVQTQIPAAEVVPGESLRMHEVATVKSSIPVRWVAVRYPGNVGQLTQALNLKANQPVTRDDERKLPANTPLSQPYWLREDHGPGMFTVSDPSLIGLAENPPAFPIEQVFEVGGQTLVIPDEPVAITADAAKGETHQRMEVIPPVSLSFASDVRLFAPGSEKQVQVTIRAYRPNVAGTLQLDAPAGWKVAPASIPFRLAAVGDHADFSFTVNAPAQPAAVGIAAHVEIDGARFETRRSEIRYDHIPTQMLEPVARFKAVALDLAIRGRQVGYLPGAGDSVEQSLAEMGFALTTLTGADLTAERLKTFDAVVIGVRAFNVRTDLAPQIPALLAYVEAGGTVVAQYNTPGGLKTPKLGPYNLTLSGNLPANRVTDPKATVTLLVPDHPAFNSPNKIVPSDFDGWVQERGLNFPNEWDREHWTALLACSDVGEAPLTSGLLVAHYGKGYYVYTGLSWFRQLPAGVPGAYRIFANLVSLGK
jgi:LmbE family N-acetylglucosaminyl deacetylase